MALRLRVGIRHCRGHDSCPSREVNETLKVEEHRHSAIRYVTPSQRHCGEDHDLLEQRRAVYESARLKNPQRWSGKTRNWNPLEEVWLNLPKEHQAEKEQESKAA